MDWKITALFFGFFLTVSVQGFKHKREQNQYLWDNEIDDKFDNAFETDLCETLFCRKGEECAVDGRIASCKCRKTCPMQGVYVCASDARTYPSHCEVHRQACLTNQRLWVVSLGPCDGTKQKVPTQFESDFDENSEPDQHQPVKYISIPNTGTLNLEHLNHPNGLRMSEIIAPKIISFEATLRHHKDEIQKIVHGAADKVENEESETHEESGEVDENGTEDEDEQDDEEDQEPLTVPSKDPSEHECDRTDYRFMRDNLLLYFHAKYAETRQGSLEHGKQYIVDLMFETLDNNGDDQLTADELNSDQEESSQFRNLLPLGCNLSEIITFSDMDKNGRVSKSEFFRSYGFPTAVLPEESVTKDHTVLYGEQYQILCNIQVPKGKRVVWSRYEKPLTNTAPNNFEFSKDGASLYLTPAYLVHSGNFSCEYRRNGFPTVNQTHVVTVTKDPITRVTPSFLLLKTGEQSRLYCDFQGSHGLDPGQISWEKNGRRLSNNSTILEFKNAQLDETGSYACSLSTQRGTARAAASVVVRKEFHQPERTLRDDQNFVEIFAVLYQGGIRSFDADTCTLQRVVPSSYMAPALNRPSLCDNYRCEWSDAVTAGSLLYATLSKEKVLAVVDLNNGAVKQILPVDFYPQRLFYIPWKDTVWVETWHDSTGIGRTILVIHSASSDVRHGLTHALPLIKSFDTVSNIFLPTSNVRNNPVLYGYVTHTKEEGLHKLDLHKLSAVSSCDLSQYKCHPKDVAYLTNGLVVVYCVDYHSGQPRGQLVMDYLTDAVQDVITDVHGVPVVTPDSGMLLSIDQAVGRIFVQKVIGRGLKLTRTIDALFPLVDWTVFPSDDGNFGYDIYAISPKINFIIKICLESGKIEHLGLLPETEFLEKKLKAGIHGKFISTKSKVSGKFLAVATSPNNVTMFELSDIKNPNCQVGELPEIASIIWV